MKKIQKTYSKHVCVHTCQVEKTYRKNIKKTSKKQAKRYHTNMLQYVPPNTLKRYRKDVKNIWKIFKMIQKLYKKYTKKIRKIYKKDTARNHAAYCSDPPVQITCSHWVSLLQPTRTDTHPGYLYNSPPEQILTWTIPQHCPWGQVGGWGSPGGGELHHSGGGGGSRLGVPGGWLHAWGRVWQPSRLGGTPPKQGVLGLVCLLHTHRACSPIMARTNR